MKKVDFNPYGSFDPFLRYYRPNAITKFNTKVECPTNYYSAGLFCYKNCEDYGMTKSGCASCASSQNACKKAILSMVVDTIVGILKAIGMFVTAGNEGVHKVLDKIKKGITLVADYIIDDSFDTVIELFKSKNWQTFKKAAIVALEAKLKYAFKTTLRQFSSDLQSQQSTVDTHSMKSRLLKKYHYW